MHILAYKTMLATEGSGENSHSVSSTSPPPRHSFPKSQFLSYKTGKATYTWQGLMAG